MSLFGNKTLMITGGTGSFGNAVLNRFLSTDIGEIRVFSRDEKKQDDMRHEFQAKMPEVAEKIKFYIGDVRDIQSVREAVRGVDYIFHAAALKQVPSCEFFPMEAVRTERHRHRQCAYRRDRGGGGVRHLPFHRQGGVPDKRDGDNQGYRGKGRRCQVEKLREDKDLLHPVRKRHVQPRLGHPAVDRADTERQPRDRHRPRNDEVHHVA